MVVPNNRSIRLERRLRLALRLVLYPLAIGLIALSWQRTHPKTVAHVDGPPPPVQWHGQTSQRQAILMVTALRRLQSLRTFVVLPCDDGSSVGFDIVMTAQNLVRRGDQFKGSQQDKILKDSAGRAMTANAWVRASTTGNLKGTLTATAVTIDRQVGCKVRPISFTSTPAERTRPRG